jgi:hypothetical protein
MKLITSELEIKNKKFIIKYGLILLGISLLILLIAGTIAGTKNGILELKIPNFFKGMLALPFPVFLTSWILMLISYQIQIISNSDFSRLTVFFKGKVDAQTNRIDNVVFSWFAMQILLGFFGHAFYFGVNGSINEKGIDDIIGLFLISISPTILFIISSYFARLNRIENKIDLLLKEKEEENNN